MVQPYHLRREAVEGELERKWLESCLHRLMTASGVGQVRKHLLVQGLVAELAFEALNEAVRLEVFWDRCSAS